MSETRHTTPKCLSCGTITPWRQESLLLPRHFLIFFLLFWFFGAGFIYLLVVIAMRSGERPKICPSCGARNLWTFLYDAPTAPAAAAPPALDLVQDDEAVDRSRAMAARFPR